MKNSYYLINEGLGSFLKQIEENVRIGHYVEIGLSNGLLSLVGKVTYITSENIYIDKEKYSLRVISEIKRLSKKECE